MRSLPLWLLTKALCSYAVTTAVELDLASVSAPDAISAQMRHACDPRVDHFGLAERPRHNLACPDATRSTATQEELDGTRHVDFPQRVISLTISAESKSLAGMTEYKITRQAVDMEWAAVKGAPAREIDLHPPSGEDWKLHSFEHSDVQVVAVWEREKRPHEMSEIYSGAEGESTTIKTIAEMPEPR